MQCSGKKMFDFMFWMWIWLCCKRINTLMCVFAVAGVIYVCVHSATKVIASDYGGLSDPYCVVFSDRRRVRVISFFIPIQHRWNFLVAAKFCLTPLLYWSLKFIIPVSVREISYGSICSKFFLSACGWCTYMKHCIYALIITFVIKVFIKK